MHGFLCKLRNISRFNISGKSPLSHAIANCLILLGDEVTLNREGLPGDTCAISGQFEFPLTDLATPAGMTFYFKPARQLPVKNSSLLSMVDRL